jgi:hypothetical protein
MSVATITVAPIGVAPFIVAPMAWKPTEYARILNHLQFLSSLPMLPYR